jgi:anaerobic selenocysteine-containing dehydrogenase
MQTTIRAACPHDCPDTCAMLVTVDGYATDSEGRVTHGRATAVKGDPDHSPTQGVLCNKVSKYLDRTYAPDRVLTPLKRIAPKGMPSKHPSSGHFQPISWDEALDTIATRFKAVAQDNPQSILPYSYAGTMGMVQGSSIDRRFFHVLGASLLDRTICSSAGKEGMALVVGSNIGPEVERFAQSKLILLWGTNPVTSSIHLWARVNEAKRAGAKVIAIDPYRSLSAEKCSQHIQLKVGTDAALALGMMHVLIQENLLDHDYIARYTQGFEALKARALDYPPAKVADITGVSVGEIVQLARDWGTATPAVIRVNYGAQRHAGGGSAIRAIACLPALTGAWRSPAGGVLLGSGGIYPLNQAALERPDLIWNAPQTINMSLLGEALTRGTQSGKPLAAPIRAMMVYNSNPAAVAPQSGEVLAGMARSDLFTVVMDSFLTDTCDYADIVLPATTQLEHFDIHKSYGHTHWLVNHPAIPPVGESKPNSEVFRLLAKRMGMTEPSLFEEDETIAHAALHWNHPLHAGWSFDDLKARGWRRLNLPESFAPFAQGGFPTPSGKCEFTSDRAVALGLSRVPDYVPLRESTVTDAALAARFPLQCISPPTRNFMNSTFVNIPVLVKEESEPHLDIHPVDAAQRDIKPGDMLRVFNDRGAFFTRARVTEKTREGMVTALSLWWHKLVPGARNANAVTSQHLTDIGRGPTFYDCLVEVERVAD